MPASHEPRHPIGVVADRTGLTPDVLRVWERRYGVVEPKRSPGGQRIYSDADIERLSLLHRATRGGHGISRVASLSKAKLEDLVTDIESSPTASAIQFVPAGESETLVDQAIAFADALDPAGLESLLRRTLSRYGLVTFIDSIAAPFLREVGEQWHEGKLSISQEHLATAVLQRIVSESAPLITGTAGSPTIVIATLGGERHASGALMAAATAGSEGCRVIYLGTDLPVSEIAETAARTNAHAIGISMVYSDKKSRTESDLRELESIIPKETALLVGGAGAQTMRRPQGRSRTAFLESMSELRSHLSQIRLRST
jgi:DNA-binding transcriptional MerR regulator/methylmalonyl-CoA mutase cobalamin-binding subunit